LFLLFATSVTDTSGTGGEIFAADVVDTGGAPWLANISSNFHKNVKWPKCYFQGLGEKRWFMKKNLKQQILLHCPF